ncbi:MAG TPA: SDR family NAD(P)-dependent oxidoreductase [Egibacteraceae bacterium]|nr:SDR family NAD(P)-dependent oxidoreductase [Egibacteraceae bacterium]
MATAIVTGASRGLGRALARALAANDWTVVADARDADALDRALADAPGTVRVPGDVTEPDHRAALVRAAVDAGGLDALVCNAGTLGPAPPPQLADLDLTAFAETLATNTVAQAGLIQAALPALRPGGVVVAVTSDAALEPYPGWSAYGASKAALEQIANVLSAERPDLRVYRVDPGDMRTAMHAAAFPHQGLSHLPEPEVSVPGLVRLLDGHLPSGRYEARAVAVADGVIG